MIYTFGEFHIDTATFSLTRAGAAVRLEPQEFDVLVYLIEHRDRVVTRDELLDTLWKGKVVTDSAVSSRLKAIRRAAGDSGTTQRVIQTVHGRGYRFIASLDSAHAESAPRDGTVPPHDQPATGGPGAPAATETAAARTRIAAPLLAGRSTEIDALTRLFDESLAYRTGIVFVLGESGIGKTALVNKFVTGCVARAGGWVLAGQTLRQADATEPYHPLIDALARASQSPRAGELFAAFEAAAPTWRAHFPEIVGAPSSTAVANVPINRERLLLELTHAFATLSERAPMVLVLEDLQWADPSTLEWIDYLARRATPARLLVLATVRAPSGREDASRLATTLATRQLAQRIDLEPLDEAGVAEFLAGRLAGPADAEAVTALTHYCAGHPLFMNVAVDSWLRATAGTTELAQHLAVIPGTLRELVEAGLSQLDAKVVDLLEAASIAGTEFTALHIAAALETAVDDVEHELIKLARLRGIPLISGEMEWPDGTYCTRFRFSHQFFAQAIYDRQGATQRRRRHAAIARRLVLAYAHRAAEHASELADHFEKAGDRAEAVHYCTLAARYAAERGAPRESVVLARRGLELHQEHEPNGDGAERALPLLILLGTGLITTEGYAAPETTRTYEAAYHASRRLGRGRHLLPVLYGLWNTAIVAGPQPRAHDLGQEFLDLARREQDPAEAVAWRAVGWPELLMGRFASAASAFEMALMRTRPERYASLIAEYGELPDVAAQAALGWARWLLGERAQGLDTTTAAVARAAELNHPFSLAYALAAEAMLLQMQDEPEAVLASSVRAVANADLHGIPLFSAWGRIFQGWAQAALGDAGRGIALIESGLDESAERGATLFYPYFASLLAEQLHANGRTEAALGVLDRAQATGEHNEERFALAELERLRGRLLFATDRGAARGAFRRAIEVARAQESPTLELRATLEWALAERASARPGAGRRALAALYPTLGPGMAGRDLEQARNLIT